MPENNQLIQITVVEVEEEVPNPNAMCYTTILRSYTSLLKSFTANQTVLACGKGN